jgi:hypothetical protein
MVDAKPTAETIDRRTAAIQDLTKALIEPQSWDVVLGSVVGVVEGFEANRANTSPAVELIYQSLHAKDSTVPKDLSDNALELRAAAATSIGEILVRNPQSPPSMVALVVASSLLSGLALRTPVKERYVKAVLDELTQAARETLHRAQLLKRRRTAPGKALSAIDEKNIPDVATALPNLIKAAKELAKEFSDQASLDREELNVLWWVFAESSSTFGARVEDLPPGKAAFAVGAELANLCLLPPPDSAAALLKRAARLIKKGDTKRPLEKAIEETDKASWALLSTEEDEELLGDSYPVLAPLTWLSAKLQGSSVAAGWGAEFSAKTGVESVIPLNPLALAEQVFLERVVQRLYQQ